MPGLVLAESPPPRPEGVQVDASTTAAGSTPLGALDGDGGVYYGTQGASVKVHYYLSNGSIYRQEGNGPAVVLADNVEGFLFDVTDIGKVVKTKITFKPRFTSTGASDTATASTAFYNTTLLRNTRTDVVSGVY